MLKQIFVVLAIIMMASAQSCSTLTLLSCYMQVKGDQNCKSGANFALCMLSYPQCSSCTQELLEKMGLQQEAPEEFVPELPEEFHQPPQEVEIPELSQSACNTFTLLSCYMIVKGDSNCKSAGNFALCMLTYPQCSACSMELMEKMGLQQEAPEEFVPELPQEFHQPPQVEEIEVPALSQESACTTFTLLSCYLSIKNDANCKSAGNFALCMLSYPQCSACSMELLDKMGLQQEAPEEVQQVPEVPELQLSTACIFKQAACQSGCSKVKDSMLNMLCESKCMKAAGC